MKSSRICEKCGYKNQYNQTPSCEYCGSTIYDNEVKNTIEDIFLDVYATPHSLDFLADGSIKVKFNTQFHISEPVMVALWGIGYVISDIDFANFSLVVRQI